MNPASAIMAMMIGMIATMRLNARPDAKLNTQSLLNFVINACRDLKPFTLVFTTPGVVDGAFSSVAIALLLVGISLKKFKGVVLYYSIVMRWSMQVYQGLVTSRKTI